MGSYPRRCTQKFVKIHSHPNILNSCHGERPCKRSDSRAMTLFVTFSKKVRRETKSQFNLLRQSKKSNEPEIMRQFPQV